MTSDPYEDERTPLSDRLAAYYRDVIALHADDPVVGACLVCRTSRCEDWRSASDRLGHAVERPRGPVATVAAQPGRLGDWA